MNGNYVVELFGMYYKSTEEGWSYVDISLARDVADATRYESKRDAEFLANKYNGKVMKINLKLEEA